MAILANNAKLIKVGQDYSAGSGISIDEHVISVTGELGNTYSAGDNIDIYEKGEQLYISSKDWSNDIANASANALNEAISQIPDPFDPTFISAKVDNKLDTTAFTNWQNGQYSTDLQTIEGQISNKLEKSEFSQVSSTFLTAINIPESAVWQDVSTTVQTNSAQWSQGGEGDVEVNNYVYNNSAKINDVNSSYQENSGTFLTSAPANMATTGDIAELAQTISETYQVKGDYATVEDVESATSGKAYTSGVINYFNKPVGVGSNESVWARDSTLHAGTAEAIYLYASGDKANHTIISPTGIWTKSANNKTIDIQKLSAMTTGFTAAGIEIGQDKVEISGGGYGVQIRTPNTAMASAGLYYSANQFVQRYSPVFSAKNASGDGFSIWAGGARGFDASGNTIWDATAPAKLIGWSNYQGTSVDSRAAGINGSIIATVYPDQIPNDMAISSAPYTYMNGDGFYAINNSICTISIDTHYSKISLENKSKKVTATISPVDVSYSKYNNDTSANDVWSLTGSVQKREIEYDADTSAITAIAGSAIGGGGVTGEFVPQSAFDELKASYDALSSLFATYSGQWLLPNEGV